MNSYLARQHSSHYLYFSFTLQASLLTEEQLDLEHHEVENIPVSLLEALPLQTWGSQLHVGFVQEREIGF